MSGSEYETGKELNHGVNNLPLYINVIESTLKYV